MVFVCNASGGIFRSPSVVSKRCLFLPGFVCDGSGGHHGSRLMCLPTGHTCLYMCAIPEKFAVVVVVVIVVVVVTDVFVDIVYQLNSLSYLSHTSLADCTFYPTP